MSRIRALGTRFDVVIATNELTDELLLFAPDSLELLATARRRRTGARARGGGWQIYPALPAR